MPWLARFPMSISAHDVAAELRRRLGDDLGGVKLHKLLYYVQGWHLTWADEPLFRERIEAWTNGPVVADLWHDEKKDRARPPAQQLAALHLATIEYVVDRYGGSSATDLIRQTHNEDPWRDASESDAAEWGLQNPEISHEALRQWFGRDKDYLRLTAERERLKATGTDMLAPLEITDELEAAIARTLAGERIRHTRPR